MGTVPFGGLQCPSLSALQLTLVTPIFSASGSARQSGQCNQTADALIGAKRELNMAWQALSLKGSSSSLLSETARCQVSWCHAVMLFSRLGGSRWFKVCIQPFVSCSPQKTPRSNAHPHMQHQTSPQCTKHTTNHQAVHATRTAPKEPLSNPSAHFCRHTPMADPPVRAPQSSSVPGRCLGRAAMKFCSFSMGRYRIFRPFEARRST